MTGLAIFALASALILCCGVLSFLLMFDDITPSQNSYSWPWLIPAGAIGLLISAVAALAMLGKALVSG